MVTEYMILIRAEVAMTSAFCIKERDYMQGMKGIYRFNPALVGGIISICLEVIVIMILSH